MAIPLSSSVSQLYAVVPSVLEFSVVELVLVEVSLPPVAAAVEVGSGVEGGGGAYDCGDGV